MIFNILINNTLRVWGLFRQNLYGDPSYLTHTLPIPRPTVYLSKALDGLITLTMSFGVIGLTLFLQYYGTELWTKAGLFLKLLAGGHPVLVVCLLIGIFFLEIVNMFQCGFTGLILGHKMNKNKVGYSVLAGLGVYVAGQLFILAVIGVIALFNQDVMNLFTGNQTVMMKDIWLLMAVCCVLYAGLVAGCYGLNVKLFKQGVDVD